MSYRKILLFVLAVLFAFSVSACAKSIIGDENTIPIDISEDRVTDDLTIEKNSMKQEMIELALSCKDIYELINKSGGYDPHIDEVRKIRNEIIKRIANKGLPVIGSDNSNMENYNLVEDFLFKALDGQEAEISYYCVFDNGEFSCMDFHAKDTTLTLTTAQLWWDSDMEPVVGYVTDYEIIQWTYTEKGYFFYETNFNGMRYENNNAVRVKPLSESDLELCEKYISPIGYQGNNLFLTDWDQSSMEQIDFNDLYEFLYHIDYGKMMQLDIYKSSIPAEKFESLIMKYFNVTSEFLQNTAVYFTDSREYFWTYLSCSISVYPAPLPEVVDSHENGDGIITMVVDAMYREYSNDRAFTHEVTIKINDDGSFQYLSNRIRPENKANVPEYISRYAP